MKEMDYISESIQKERVSARREIENNQSIWKMTLDYLKSIDQDWEGWYETDAIPETIYWQGEEFQKVLKTLWIRIGVVKEKHYEKATHITARPMHNGSFICLWGRKRKRTRKKPS